MTVYGRMQAAHDAAEPEEYMSEYWKDRAEFYKTQQEEYKEWREGMDCEWKL